MRASDETLENSGAAAAYRKSASRDGGDIPDTRISWNERGVMLQQAITAVVVTRHRSLWKFLGAEIDVDALCPVCTANLNP